MILLLPALVRRFKPAIVLIGFVLGFASEVSAQLGDTTSTNGQPEEALPTLMLANRRICTFRATLDGFSPEERAAAAQARVESVLAKARTLLVTTHALTNGIQIQLDGKGLFLITPDDVFSIRGQTLESKANNVAAELRQALHDLHSLSSTREVLMAGGKALLGFVYFGVLLWVVRRARSWLMVHSTRLAAERTKGVNSQELRTAGLRSFVEVARALLNFGSYLLIALLVYSLLWYELRCFPYSRPWGDLLRSRGVAALHVLGENVLDALPELLVVVLILLVVRTLVHVVTRLFAVVERGEIQSRWFDPIIAATTRRIVVVLIWVVAIVIAYPYIPGSQSLAFKGVTVFAGLVVSLGSTNLVNQIASGLLLIYSRAFRVGDYVRVGQTEGSVVGIGLYVTRIRTIQNEEVHIANSVLLSSATTNYSRLAMSDGLFLSIKVTIGYRTPWRQVHAMLLQAARQTSGLLMEPEPFVLQTALSDFYVEYELNARLEIPERRVWVRSDLNSNIQDVFNEQGVQIMSPHYLADPPTPQVVPKSKWFLTPASDDRAEPTSIPEARPERTIQEEN